MDVGQPGRLRHPASHREEEGVGEGRHDCTRGRASHVARVTELKRSLVPKAPVAMVAWTDLVPAV